MSKRKHQHDVGRDARRTQFVSPQRRRGVSWTWVIAGAAGLFIASLVYAGKDSGGGGPAAAGPEAADVLPSGQDVSLPASLLDDGKPRFYRYVTSIGREIRFFVLKSSDGVIRAAFDACDVCYRERKGYHPDGDVMVCNNCGRSFRSADVNVITGGCNPAALQRTVEGGRVLIQAANVDLGAAYF